MSIVTVTPDTTALGSVFTPPSYCSTFWTYEDEVFNSIPGGLLLQNALATPRDTECYPTDVVVHGRLSHFEYYSPGYCPKGYSTPIQSVGGPTTSIICCQSSYSYTSTITTVNGGASDPVLFAGCVSTFPSGKSTVVPSYGADHGLTTVTVEGPLEMWQQPSQFAYQKSDLSFFTTSSASSLPSRTARSTTNSAAAASSPTSIVPTPTSSLSSNSSGLSTGAKAGIGVGVSLAALIFLALLSFFIWRRRRTARSLRSELPMNTAAEKPFLGGHQQDETSPVEMGGQAWQLDSVPRVEAPNEPAEYRMPELPDNSHNR